MMSRFVALLLLLAFSGCGGATDPYTRTGSWRPTGANDANLRAMVAVPSDLTLSTPAAPSDGGLAAAAATRLRRDRVRPLLDSGLAHIVPVNSGSASQPAAPAAPGNE